MKSANFTKTQLREFDSIQEVVDKLLRLESAYDKAIDVLKFCEQDCKSLKVEIAMLREIVTQTLTELQELWD